MRVVLVTLYIICTVAAATVTFSQVTAAPGPDAFWQEYDHLSVDSLCTPYIPWVHLIWQVTHQSSQLLTRTQGLTIENQQITVIGVGE